MSNSNSNLSSTISYQYTVFNIRYDIDKIEENDIIELPEKITFSVPLDIHQDSDKLEEFLSDEISNTTGFCHLGFDFAKGVK